MRMSGKIRNLTGQTFGRLYVLELDYLNPKLKNAAYWKCKCSCGNITTTRGALLKDGTTKSCGCLQKELASIVIKKEIIRRTLPNGTSARNELYRQYKNGAKVRGLEFNLEYKYFMDVTAQNCNYCGSAPLNTRYNKRWNGKYIFNGIDRVDNSKGYIIGNVVPCCKRCNAAKSDLSENDFLKLIINIFYTKKLYLHPISTKEENDGIEN